ncbi:MAG: hypothetical protein K2L38_11700, partial [Dysosmobacter sp.]|nr:hypothetical protein [Dysosmobacter sp.]
YFLGFLMKTENFGENALFPVEKKSLLFGGDFRILGNTGGEKWGFKADKWSLPPFRPTKGGKGAAPWRGCWANRITALTPRAAL